MNFLTYLFILAAMLFSTHTAEQKAKAAEKWLPTQDHQLGIFIDLDGKEIYRIQGDEKQIVVPKDWMPELAGAVFTRNSVAGYWITFTPDDINLAIEAKLSVIRVTSIDAENGAQVSCAMRALGDWPAFDVKEWGGYAKAAYARLKDGSDYARANTALHIAWLVWAGEHNVLYQCFAVAKWEVNDDGSKSK